MFLPRARKITALLLAFLLSCSLIALSSCGNGDSPEETGPAETTATVPDETDPGTDTAEPLPESNTLNGDPLEDFQIVYAEDGESFNLNAAEYVASNIEAITGVKLPVVSETDSAERDCEILVGLTGRDACAGLDEAEIAQDEFVLFSSGRKVVLYGYAHMVAGAAYRFIADSFTAPVCAVTIPEDRTCRKHVPAEEVNHVIFVIADGMGPNCEAFCEQIENDNPSRAKFLSYAPDYPTFPALFHDFPVEGTLATCNIHGTITDSAAAATAFSTGYKTSNRRCGVSPDGSESYQNLPELCKELGWKIAVVATDKTYGATESAFTVHTDDRDDDEEVTRQQEELGLDVLIGKIDTGVIDTLRSAFDQLGDGKFLMMYEEGYIDKDATSGYPNTYYYDFVRLNHALRGMIEYMLYHPDTILIVTADHECGGVLPDENGRYRFTYNDHTAVDVPFYAIGTGTDVFNGCNHDNTFVAKFIASVMGREIGTFGDPDLPVEPDERYVVPEEWIDPYAEETDENGVPVEPDEEAA